VRNWRCVTDDRDDMAISTKVSKTGVWVVLGVLGIAAAQGMACSKPFHSCYETRTCPAKPHDAGAAGEESGGISGELEGPTGEVGGTSGVGQAAGSSAAGADSDERCPTGTHNCAGECVSDDSIDHCGARCEPCPAPTGGTAVCDAGACGIDCGDLKKCGTVCTAGCCADTDCTPQAGKAGKCDTATNTCRYDCAVGSKPCGARACIPEANCCSPADCKGTCSTCSSSGTCVAVKGADDPDSCAGTCDASGACKSKLGQTCLTAGACVSGTTCAPDGYCCNTACAESCQACDIKGSEGTCTPVSSGKPHGTRASCGSDATCGGSCTGRADGKCSYPTNNCGSASSCSGSELVGQAKCSNGECVTPAAQACTGGFACVGSACKTSCSADSDCAAGSYCQENKCHVAATQVTTGTAFSCARLGDGSVVCWGSNRSGALGTAVADGFGTTSTTPVKVNGLGGVKAVSAGWNHACAVLTNGAVWCWGDSGSGQLGNGILPTENGGGYSARPVAVTGLPSAVTAIDCGNNVSCALVGSTGAVYCWGSNISGELGADAPSNELHVSATPIKIAGLGVATSVSVDTTVCSTVGASLFCWGANGGHDNVSPAYVSSLSGFGAVQSSSTGDYNTCAVVAGGNLYCWGWNAYGALGDPSTPVDDRSALAVRVQGLGTGATQVSTGFLNSCALLTTGKVSCWGLERHGALGNGVIADDGYSQTPVAVSNLVGAKSISVSALHGCALLSNGSVQCWGEGAEGQLGNGAAADASVPVMVTGW